MILMLFLLSAPAACLWYEHRHMTPAREFYETQLRQVLPPPSPKRRGAR